MYGVPETFVIDKNGVIRHKQIGPITPEALEKTILPLIDRAEEIMKRLFALLLVALALGTAGPRRPRRWPKTRSSSSA